MEQRPWCASATFMVHSRPMSRPSEATNGPVATTSEEFEFTAADGRRLVGRFFGAPKGTARGAVLICGATGVQQRFYAPLAGWLAEQCFATATFDFRGIGRSLIESHVRLCPARKQDWGELDIPAALD